MYEGKPVQLSGPRMVNTVDGSLDPLPANDKAAQAGMIVNILKGLGPVAFAALTVSCAPDTVPCSCKSPCCSGHRALTPFVAAIARLADEAVSWTGPRASYHARTAILLKLYGGKNIKLSEIAEECEYDSDTINRYHKVILRQMMGGKAGKLGPAVEGVEPAAWKDAASLLRHVGIVG